MAAGFAAYLTSDAGQGVPKAVRPVTGCAGGEVAPSSSNAGKAKHSEPNGWCRPWQVLTALRLGCYGLAIVMELSTFDSGS